MENIFIPDKVEAIVLFIHGMQDHRSRYINFCEKLKDANCLVILLDLNGHGENKPRGTIGGYQQQTQLLIDRLEAVSQDYNVKRIVIGHSMGSLFARNMMMTRNDLIDFCILSGSPSNSPLAKPLSIFLNGYNYLFKRKDKFNRFLNWLIIYQYNIKVKRPKTSHDWLSFDEHNVKTYLASEDCGFDFSNDGFYDLFSLLATVNQQGDYQFDTPVLFVTGQHDPCATQLQKTIDVVASFGHPTQSISYPNSRHEIFFDYDKEEVQNDIIKAIKSFV